MQTQTKYEIAVLILGVTVLLLGLRLFIVTDRLGDCSASLLGALSPGHSQHHYRRGQ